MKVAEYIFKSLAAWNAREVFMVSGGGALSRRRAVFIDQLHRPADQTGCIIAFRRAQSQQADYTVKLSALQADDEYLLESCDGAAPQTIAGKQMMEGMTLHLDRPRSSALIFYRKK